ncbi:hypothetical protein DY000_02061502 [Brassica cretica]|uniref:Uncharacterized protein n=1 Tax=Brassica cretica TaxID=69181 RepID=A0ABQ7ANI6_BRACR|nr:hypothetical protein DY000_02061502 [Brassica cretica]
MKFIVVCNQKRKPNQNTTRARIVIAEAGVVIAGARIIITGARIIIAGTLCVFWGKSHKNRFLLTIFLVFSGELSSLLTNNRLSRLPTPGVQVSIQLCQHLPRQISHCRSSPAATDGSRRSDYRKPSHRKSHLVSSPSSKSEKSRTASQTARGHDETKPDMNHNPRNRHPRG